VNGSWCFGLLIMFCEASASTGGGSVVVCPPVVEWPADLQQRAAKELRALPEGSALREVVRRAIEQRDVNRRCVAEQSKGNTP
jgi:hypothetical protein